MLPIYILLAILALLAVGVVVLFNSLVQRRQMTNNGWSDIDVQLKRRSDLIPSLVETVKGYAAHEKSLFEDVVAKRAEALAAGDDVESRGGAESALSAPVARLFALAENYPDLKANENFLALQTELADTEDKIEMARRFYNGAVRELNTAIETFPSNLVANIFGFAKRDYFEIQTAERAVPSVDLGASA